MQTLFGNKSLLVTVGNGARNGWREHAFTPGVFHTASEFFLIKSILVHLRTQVKAPVPLPILSKNVINFWRLASS